MLRELEEMGYREIAMVADVPIGTVMSRLARGRRKLAALLTEKQGGATAPHRSPMCAAPGTDDARAATPGTSKSASANVTPLRASANGRPLNTPGGTAAGNAQETPDGL
jgi:RNA polymerase sigma-70 factor (ECF subfamily)